MNSNGMKTGYFGENGGIAPLFSCGGRPLAPSMLTGNGSHVGVWTSILIHVIALGTNIAANVAFFVNSGDTAGDLLVGWAVCSLTLHALGVLGTLAITAFVRDVWSMPITTTVQLGCFFAAILATVKASYTHGAAQPADNVENVNYNLSLLFQCLGVASILGNSLTALANKGI